MIVKGINQITSYCDLVRTQVQHLDACQRPEGVEVQWQGFRVQVSVRGSGFRIQGSEGRVQGSGCGVGVGAVSGTGFGLRLPLHVRVEGFGFGLGH